jgi:hypothetical protein
MVNFKDKELTAFSSMLINYGFYRPTRKILTDFPQVWVLFATLVAQSTPQVIAASVVQHMKKFIFLILTLLISNTILAQKNNAELGLYEIELNRLEINEILYYPFSDLTEDPPVNLTEKETLIKLKEKTNSELNTLASIILNYKYADKLDIGITEKILLLIRLIEICDKFYEKNELIFLEHSKGLPTIAKKKEIFENKEVRVLLMGGATSIILEDDYTLMRFYKRFNDRMKKNIAE